MLFELKFELVIIEMDDHTAWCSAGLHYSTLGGVPNENVGLTWRGPCCNSSLDAFFWGRGSRVELISDVDVELRGSKLIHWFWGFCLCPRKELGKDSQSIWKSWFLYLLHFTKQKVYLESDTQVFSFFFLPSTVKSVRNSLSRYWQISSRSSKW